MGLFRDGKKLGSIQYTVTVRALVADLDRAAFPKSEDSQAYGGAVYRGPLPLVNDKGLFATSMMHRDRNKEVFALLFPGDQQAVGDLVELIAPRPGSA